MFEGTTDVTAMAVVVTYDSNWMDGFRNSCVGLAHAAKFKTYGFDEAVPVDWSHGCAE